MLKFFVHVQKRVHRWVIKQQRRRVADLEKQLFEANRNLLASERLYVYHYINFNIRKDA